MPATVQMALWYSGFAFGLGMFAGLLTSCLKVSCSCEPEVHCCLCSYAQIEQLNKVRLLLVLLPRDNTGNFGLENFARLLAYYKACDKR